MSDIESWQSLLQPNTNNHFRSSKWSQKLFLIESLMDIFDSQGEKEHSNLGYQNEFTEEDSSAKNISSLGSTFLKEEVSEKNLEFDGKKGQTEMKKKSGCKCKKSFCLKSYCDCYSLGGFCSPDCGCIGCQNTFDNFEEVKISRSTKKNFNNKTNHSCNCKKSKCSKNYCECFNAGVPCGEHCNCEGCDNCSGKKNEVKFIDQKIEVMCIGRKDVLRK